MPINPSDLLISQVTEEDFKEFVHGTDSMRTDSLSLGACDLSWTCKLPGDKLKACLQWILGVNYVDYNNVLHRTCPMFHPAFPFAFAKSVMINGQQYDGDDKNAVVWDFQSTPAKWKQYKCEISFSIPRFDVLYDDEVTDESQRFVSNEEADDVRIVTVENGAVVYEANPGDAWNNEAHNSTLPIARRDGAGLLYTWWHVPADFVQANNKAIRRKMLIAQGKSNATAIFDAAPEELMLEKVTSDKYVSPLLTDQIGELSFMFDFHFHFKWTSQLASQMGISTETRRGWNFQLGPEMRYWRIRNKKNGELVFPPVEFAKLFTHFSDTIA